MSKTYREYEPEQMLRLPPNMREWLPEGQLALFLSDVVDELGLSALVQVCEEGDGRMCEQEKEREGEVAGLLREAEAADAAEDARYGKGKRGDELAAELA